MCEKLLANLNHLGKFVGVVSFDVTHDAIIVAKATDDRFDTQQKRLQPPLEQLESVRNRGWRIVSTQSEVDQAILPHEVDVLLVRFYYTTGLQFDIVGSRFGFLKAVDFSTVN